ncbi:hypothetical protein [Duganella sp. HH105]|uniref:DUF7738 domain-containing protein n=1 Tax=Duganella sp. HH105 TaxID=1781067 RepID=UPI000892E35F|nr:hypothetical protein [Duganella sp. HH105]OEZ63606.1 hypothetical protein DUGA6_01070 [Duganella sp. HH105]
MNYFLTIFLFILLILSGPAHTASEQKPADSSVKKSMADLWNNAVRKAAQATGTETQEHSYGEPRTVSRGARPEIILRQDKILYNGKMLELGKTASQWDSILPGERRCDDLSSPSWCNWDDLGILVGFTDKKPKKISYVTIYLRLPEVDPNDGLVTMSADGTVLPPLVRFYPKSPFPGYLELDGYGMDRHTMFWEVLKRAEKKRNIHCGLRDCVAPGGTFGSNTVMYFDLDTPVETGAVNNINISSRAVK